VPDMAFSSQARFSSKRYFSAHSAPARLSRDLKGNYQASTAGLYDSLQLAS
jgi:hypothetical protein